VRCLPGVSDAASGLPSAAEAHAGRIACDRGSPRPTRSADGRPAQGHHDAVQRLADVPGLGVESAQQIIAEVGATRRDVPLIEASRLLDGRLSRQRGECGCELQSPLPERQSPDATRPQLSGQCRRKSHGDDLRRAISPARPPPWPCAGHRRHHPPAVSIAPEDPASVVWYEERGPSVNAEVKKVRARKMIRELRTLGHRVELIAPAATV
jgi:hypothetical protein